MAQLLASTLLLQGESCSPVVARLAKVNLQQQ
jgi:hypothetical protein